MAKISVLFSVLYLTAVIILHEGFAPLNQIAGLLREMMPSSRSAKMSPVHHINCVVSIDGRNFVRESAKDPGAF
jgi:hypothetical protein